MTVGLSDKTPSATVRLGDAEVEWPADWEINGKAFGLSDWSFTAYGDIPYGWGEVDVRLRTSLGVLLGRALPLDRSSSLHGSVEWRFVGAGPLRLES